MTEEECVKQGPEGRTWKFVMDKSFTWKTDRFSDKHCDFSWLKISDNEITVKATPERKYAWDGNTPKANLKFIHMTIGTPDGMLIKHQNGEYRPITYYASMVHDALYQYKRCLPISRKVVDLIFLDMMKYEGFNLSGLYHAGVRIGGGFFGKWMVKGI